MNYPYQDIPIKPKQKGPIEELIDTFKTVSWSFSFPLYLIMLVFSCILLDILTPSVLAWGGAGGSGFVFVSIIPGPVGFPIYGAVFQMWFMFVVVCINICVIKALLDFRSKIDCIKRFTMPDKARGGIETTAKLFFASIFFVYGYFIILELFGVSPSTPDFDSMPIEELIYGVVNAAVNEELVSRVMLIGIPLLFLSAWNIGPRMIQYRKGGMLKAKMKLLIGGGLPLNHVTITLILLSALAFAAAHIYSWDMYKFIPTMISGTFLGYLFVTRGLHTSIIFHFSTNFIFFAAQLWDDNMTLLVIIGLIIMAWMITGSYHFIKFWLGAFKKGKRPGSKRQKPIRSFSQERPYP
ncbi:MAG: CPBP family intramembrane metalloprotease [Thermoplasmata archaeon]|nr:CPBP family intramembrane metalloprotease [Thermoplasmata archaeon]